MTHRAVTLGVVMSGVAVLLAACGGSSGPGPSKGPTSIGKGEGALNIIVWAGYAEYGATDPTVNWVTPFQKQTGCMTNAKIAGTSDEMVSLMQTGQYDGVSASGNATLRLMVGGNVAPVNVDLIDNYKNLNPALKDQPYNTYQGTHYGIPHGWGANLLMWRTDLVNPAPTSWGAVFDPNSPYKGKVTAYDDPIYIADAALYLKKTQPSLGITDVYELSQAQFTAAVNLLKQQRTIIGQYWSDYTKAQAALSNGENVDRHDVAGDHESPRDRQAPHARPGDSAERGVDGMVRHLDGVVAGGASQLHVHVDELDHHARRAVAGCAVVRRGPGQPQGLPGHRPDRRQLLHHVPRQRHPVPVQPGAVEGAVERLW